MSDPMNNPAGDAVPPTGQPIDGGTASAASMPQASSSSAAETAAMHTEVPAGGSTEGLQAELAAVAAERDDLKDRLARARADLENYRRRMMRDLEDERKYQSLTLLRAILQPLDGLRRAVKAAEAAGSKDDLASGVSMVLRQFESALTQIGASVIGAQGQPFDPNLHEAISQVPSADHPPMTVLDEVETGYRLHDRIVRPSRVVVSTAPGK